MKHDPIIVDAYAAAEHVGRKPVTIREWASRGLLERVGTKRGRTLYRLADVVAVAEQRKPGRRYRPTP